MTTFLGRKPSLPEHPQLSWDTSLGYQAFDGRQVTSWPSPCRLRRSVAPPAAAPFRRAGCGRWPRPPLNAPGGPRSWAKLGAPKNHPKSMGVWGEKWKFYWGKTWKLYGRSMWKNGDWSIKWWKIGIGNGRSMVQEATAQPLCPLLMTRAAHLPGSCSW